MRAENAAQATAIPATPSATAQMLASHSCDPLGSTTDSTVGARKSVNGFQTPGICTQPPITESTLSTATAAPIQSHGSERSGRCRCSCTNGDGSPPKTRKTMRNA